MPDRKLNPVLEGGNARGGRNAIKNISGSINITRK